MAVLEGTKPWAVVQWSRLTPLGDVDAVIVSEHESWQEASFACVNNVPYVRFTVEQTPVQVPLTRDEERSQRGLALLEQAREWRRNGRSTSTAKG